MTGTAFPQEPHGTPCRSGVLAAMGYPTADIAPQAALLQEPHRTPCRSGVLAAMGFPTTDIAPQATRPTGHRGLPVPLITIA